MGSVIDEIQTYLVGKTTEFSVTLSSTSGTPNIFAYSHPDSTGISVGIIESPIGVAPDRVYRSALPAFHRPRVQIVVRSTKPADGSNGVVNPINSRRLADQIWNAMEEVGSTGSTVVGGTTWYAVGAITDIFQIEMDEQGRRIFACNYEVWRKPPATWTT